MKQNKPVGLKLFLFLLNLCFIAILQKQTVMAQSSTITTTAAFLNNNNGGTVTFNFQNTNAFPIVITSIDGITGAAGVVPVELWYKPLPISGPPGPVSVANGFTQVASATITGIANTTTTATQNFFNGLSLVIPAGQTYGIAVYALSQRHYIMVAPYLPTATLSAGGCNVITGTNIGYGVTLPTPAAPTATPRGWIGNITFSPVGLCTNPPATGNTNATLNPVCSNVNFTLSLAAGAGGIGQTYQWQISPDNISWSPIAGATAATYTTSQITSNYYRCVSTCGVSVTSIPLQVVTYGTPLSGTYTINAALPTGGTNFQSFNALATGLNCGGLGGPVIVNVVAGTGPYNEQVEFMQISGASPVNTVTINGNGETLTYHSTAAALPHTMALNGTDYFKVNNLNFNGLGLYALSCHLWNNANNNCFTNCTFSCPSISSSLPTQTAFSISGSPTNAIGTGLSGSNDTLQGCTTISGFYSVSLAGNPASANTGNVINDCTIKEFYTYGSYNLHNNGTVISNNLFERPTRVYVHEFFGVYMGIGCVGYKVNSNRIRHPFGVPPGNPSAAYGIYCLADGTPGNENKLINNLVSDFNSDGVIFGIWSGGADYLKVFHNTISFDQTATATALGAFGIYNDGTIGGVTIRNNIITISRGGTGFKTGLHYTGLVASNNNDVLVNGSGGNNFTGNYMTDYVTLQSWQTANGGVWDQQSVAVNPLYTSPANNDYKPSNLAINNLGAAVGVSTDILLSPRPPLAPDIGAYEFGTFALPAYISDFKGKTLVYADELTWTTSSEHNNAYFTVQHSIDGVKFTDLATVDSKALGGNSTVNLHYSALNHKPVSGRNYYRLQQTDVDGHNSLHAKIVALIRGADGNRLSIYPNPTQDVLSVDLYATKDQNTTVKILDMSGRIIKQVQTKSEAGMNHITLDVTDIAGGLYTVQVYEGERLTSTSKIRKSE